MAKISVSIPDELKDQLDTYAQDTGFNRSSAVANILSAYFQGQVVSPSDHIQTQIHELQNYLAQLHELNPDHFPRPAWLQEPAAPRSFIRRQP